MNNEDDEFKRIEAEALRQSHQSKEPSMTTLRQVAQQALETLEWCEPDYDENPTGFKKWAAVMPILRETLVVPEQRKWVGLTDEEIESAISDGFARGLDDGNVSNKTVIKYVRGIEAALRSKNT